MAVNFAMGIGMLLLGIVLPDGQTMGGGVNLPSLPLESPQAQTPTNQQPFGTPLEQRPRLRNEGARSNQPSGPGRQPDMGGATNGQPIRGGVQKGAAEPLFPNAPTQSNDFFSNPTEGLGGSSQYGTPMNSGNEYRPSLTRSPRQTAPTTRQPAKSSSNALVLQQQQQQAARLEMLAPKPAATARSSKPFSGYTPTPTVSPYLNLFRNSNSDVNNYNTLVKPYLEQEQQSRLFGGEIRGLQSSTRLQNNALQKLGKRTDLMGGTTAPEFYQNYQGFYPGFNR
jgi:hypothetical protein